MFGLPNPFGGSGGNFSSGGILNKDQTSQSTSTSNTVGAQEQSIAVGSGADVTITDGGAVERSLSFASQGQKLFFDALSALGKQSAAQATAVLATATDSIERVSIAKTEGEAQRVYRALGVGALVLVLLGGVYVYWRSR